MAQTQRKGRPMDGADAWNAAAALDLGVPLVTNNPFDYDAIDGLIILTAVNKP
jgi:predicted nucleic acid-binding protein